MMRSGLALTVGMTMVALSACSGTEDVKDAAPAIAAFHKQLNARAYHTIWEQADAGFRQSSEADLARLFSAVRDKLGDVVKSEQTGWNVNYGTGGKTVTVGMATTFQRGTGTERFVVKQDGGKLALYGYNIDSADMMLK